MAIQALTDDQFRAVQDQIDSLIRKTRSGKRGTPEEIEAYSELYSAWEAAYALSQRTKTDRAARDAALHAVATKHGLV